MGDRAFHAVAVTLLLSAFPGGLSAAEEVHWRRDYHAARVEAQQHNRPLFLDFSAEWCLPCKRLEATTFRDPAIVRLLNDQFVPVKLEGPRETRLTEALRVSAYPTLILATSEGRILRTVEGAIEPGQLRELLQNTLSTTASHQQKADALFTQARQLEARGRLLEALEAYSHLVQSHPNSSAASEAHPALVLLAAKPEVKTQLRRQRAAELLASARRDYATQQYLCCLDRCQTLTTSYADLPEGAEAAQLFEQIKNQPDWMRAATKTLAERLGELHLALAEAWLRQGQPQLAIESLERIIATLPASPHAELAKARLVQIRGQPAQLTDREKK